MIIRMIDCSRTMSKFCMLGEFASCHSTIRNIPDYENKKLLNDLNFKTACMDPFVLRQGFISKY